MTRKSELQRKLAAMPAPKPPDDLAARIKREIPKDLRISVEGRRERVASSLTGTLRIAASLVVLIATGYLAMHLLSRNEPAFKTESERPARTAMPAVTITQPATLPEPAAITEVAPIIGARREPRKAKPQSALDRVVAEKKEQPEPAVVAEAPAAPATNIAARGATAQTADFIASPAAAPPPAPAAEAAQAKRTAVMKATAAPSAAPVAAEDNAMKDSRYRVGHRDDAMVQRFAQPAALAGGVVLDVEAAEESIAPGRIVVRVSFDCGVVVTDMWVDTIVNPELRASTRWLNDNSSWRWGSSTFANQSRTTTLDFALAASGADPLVKIRATYRLGDDPIQQTVEKVIRRSDVRAWSTASARTKSVALIALWQNGALPEVVANAAQTAGLENVVRAVETP